MFIDAYLYSSTFGSILIDKYQEEGFSDFQMVIDWSDVGNCNILTSEDFRIITPWISVAMPYLPPNRDFLYMNTWPHE